jgi:hypothetical protein
MVRQGAQGSACEHSNAQRTKASPRPALPRRARLRNRGGARGPCGAPRNAGVQGGTDSSNLLCSSSQSDANRFSEAHPVGWFKRIVVLSLVLLIGLPERRSLAGSVIHPWGAIPPQRLYFVRLLQAASHGRTRQSAPLRDPSPEVSRSGRALALCPLPVSPVWRVGS